MSSGSDAFRLVLEGELETAAIINLRFELANVLGARPSEVQLRVPRPERLGGAARGLLASFYDVLSSRGGRLLFVDAEAPVVSVADATHLQHLLAGAR